MKQLFFFGSSSIYGVGGENGSYADIVKQYYHRKMYSSGGIGEKYEIFNFGLSGAKTEFVAETYPLILDRYGREGQIITILNVGGNNSKAENNPNNFVSTPEEYGQSLNRLLEIIKQKSSHTIVVGSGFCNEVKTNPKTNPLTGGRSYFTNKRREEFQKRCQDICKNRGITYISPNVDKSTWLNQYIYTDGLHANSQGYQLIAEKLISIIEALISE